MSRDSFELEKELLKLEEEMAVYFKDLEEHENEIFKVNLRKRLETLLTTEEKKEKKRTSILNKLALIKRKKISIPSISLIKFLPAKEKKKTGLPKGLKLAASFSVFIVLFGGIFWGLSKLGLFMDTAMAEEMSIEATKQDTMGVDTTSSFLLISDEPLNEKDIKEELKIKPEINYTLVKKKDSKGYEIIPENGLEYNTVYKFAFYKNGSLDESKSWAFQTKGHFNVIGSLPREKATNVPVNTGIEITFSHELVDLQGFEEHFRISPSVDGRFEKHKKTVVFIPKGLKTATIYTVKLEKGMPYGKGEQTLTDDYTFSFETASADNSKKSFSFDFDTSLTQFSTGEAPVFPAYFYSKGESPQLNINLYRYQDHRMFIEALREKDNVPQWSYYAVRSFKSDVSDLTKVAEYNTELMSVNEYQHYIVFPNALQPGHYIAEIKAGEELKQVMFQVTDLSAYMTFGNGQGLIWVNDLRTQKPVMGAAANLQSNNRDYKGNKDGVILISDSTDKDAMLKDYILISGNGKGLVLPFEGANKAVEKTIDTRMYWKYVYLDRELYQPNDEIQYWGVISPRTGGEKISEVKVELYGYESYYTYAGNKGVIKEEKAKLNGNVFNGSIKLPTLKPGYYAVRIKYKDVVLTSRGFSVETYEKPAYRITIEKKKKAVFAGEDTIFMVNTGFFEGTPAANLRLNYQINGDRGQFTTDENGKALIEYTPKGDGSNSTYRHHYLNVTADLPEAGEIRSTSNVIVFNSKLFIKGKAQRENDKYSLNLKLFDIDLSKINEGLYPNEDNFLGEAVAGKPINGSLYEDVWEKIEDGEYYDFIEKKVVKRYYHKHSSKLIKDFKLTSDKNGEAVYQGTIDPAKTYFIEVESIDDEERKHKARFYLRDGNEEGFFGYKYHYLMDDKGQEDYVPSEEIKLNFMENERIIAGNNLSFLYFTAQEYINSFQVSNEPYYTFEFTEKDIPNVNVFGVCFNGFTYYKTPEHKTVYKKEQKKLNVSLSTDKSEYKPGEKVVLNVLVKDKDGSPVQAVVNINLVDEALYSLKEQKVELLNSLYQDFIYSHLYAAVSHYHPLQDFGAECGGEGESERKDFRDTVVFTTLNTTNDGTASTEFNLPDNLTSWRLTYHAITDDIKAGSGAIQIPVRLPFFVDLVMNDTCLLGDAPMIILRAFGEKISTDTAVKYDMKLISPTGKEIESSIEGLPLKPYDWQLPSLMEKGRYEVIIKASQGDFQDAIQKEVMVVPSFMERNITQHVLLTEDINISDSSQEMTSLVFSDYEKGQYLAGLYRLSWLNGSRLEKLLARREAVKLLNNYYQTSSIQTSEYNKDNFLKYQQQDGGISILPYGESNLELTALVCSSNIKEFDEKALAAYLYKILDTEDKNFDKSLALWGLASLNQPVLQEITEYLQEETIEPAVKIHLAMASLEMGNGSSGKKIFKDLLKTYGEDLGSSMRVNVGKDQDEIIKATTQMAVLASRLNIPEKYKLYQYILENESKDTLNCNEQIQILENNLRYMNTEPVTFTYNLQGEDKTITLKDQEIYRINLTKDDLQSIKFHNIKGKVGVVASYSRAYGKGESGTTEGMSVKRAYMVNGEEKISFARTDLIKVVITYSIDDKLPEGMYEIVDVLPAGMSYVNRPYIRQGGKWEHLNYPVEVKGQKLTFVVYKGRGAITYYARIIAPGEFKAEATLLSNTNVSKFTTIGNEENIKIQ